MRFFLDTNICIYALNNKFPRIKLIIESLSPSDIGIPSIVKAELYYGALKSQKKDKVIPVLEKFLSPFEIFPFGDKEVKTYAQIRADLEREGNIIGPNDLIVAAITLSHGATLVTHNTREFQRVSNLLVEDWTQSH
ncbi:MAG: type II toxin-antitoxin system VapC family toxin [Candidatus Aminicenantes bacterium]|jgi:tRNA(fMet)-specific endonuclease VapC